MGRQRKQRELAEECDRRYRAQTARAKELTADLDEKARRRPRADGGWSIDENIAHLAQINLQHLEPLRSALDAQPGASHEAEAAIWKPTTGGRLLIWAMNSPRKMKTPAKFRPDRLDYAGDPVAVFAESQNKLCDLLDRSRLAKWRDVRLHSPASRLVRLNAGDVFVMLADHNDRHLNMVERMREDVDGDKS